MCGICGYYSPSAQLSSGPLEQATRSLAHRGPDGRDVWMHPGGFAGLGHTRLAIIDIAAGQQPMRSADGRFIIVFNGEIYNYRDLRAELQSAGHVFCTHSDTEVLLAAYRQWGKGCLLRLNGMFAFALFDTSERKLFLARDRTGIKPLYYHCGPKGLVFGSELKALLAWREIPRFVNPYAVMDFLTLTYPIPPATCFRDCWELPPGCYLEFSEKGKHLENYWAWSRKLANHNGKSTLPRLRSELEGAVREHLISDVPVGAFLSGGIDSSLIVAIMGAVSGSKFQTFNVRFAEDKYDESAYAEAVAKHVGTEHHQLRIESGKGDPALVETVLDQFDQPFGDSSAIPTYLICREIRKFVKVVISGDGGDEMFGGYPHFFHADAIRLLSIAPAKLLQLSEQILARFPLVSADLSRQLTRLLRAAQRPGQERLVDLCSIFTANHLMPVLQPDFAHALGSYRPSFLPADGECSPGGIEMMDITIRTALPGDYLRKVDVMSSAHGLEVRVPMLANSILAFSAELSRDETYSWRTNKILLRRLARKYLPSEVASKKKHGFGIPLDSWLGKAGRATVASLLLAPSALIRGIIRPDYISQLMSAFVSQNWERAQISRYSVYQRTYALWSLERWLSRWNPAI